MNARSSFHPRRTSRGGNGPRLDTGCSCPRAYPAPLTPCNVSVNIWAPTIRLCLQSDRRIVVIMYILASIVVPSNSGDQCQSRGI